MKKRLISFFMAVLFMATSLTTIVANHTDVKAANNYIEVYFGTKSILNYTTPVISKDYTGSKYIENSKIMVGYNRTESQYTYEVVVDVYEGAVINNLYIKTTANALLTINVHGNATIKTGVNTTAKDEFYQSGIGIHGEDGYVSEIDFDIDDGAKLTIEGPVGVRVGYSINSTIAGHRTNTEFRGSGIVKFNTDTIAISGFATYNPEADFNVSWAGDIVVKEAVKLHFWKYSGIAICANYITLSDDAIVAFNPVEGAKFSSAYIRYPYHYRHVNASGILTYTPYVCKGFVAKSTVKDVLQTGMDLTTLVIENNDVIDQFLSDIVGSNVYKIKQLPTKLYAYDSATDLTVAVAGTSYRYDLNFECGEYYLPMPSGMGHSMEIDCTDFVRYSWRGTADRLDRTKFVTFYFSIDSEEIYIDKVNITIDPSDMEDGKIKEDINIKDVTLIVDNPNVYVADVKWYDYNGNLIVGKTKPGEKYHMATTLKTYNGCQFFYYGVPTYKDTAITFNDDYVMYRSVSDKNRTIVVGYPETIDVDCKHSQYSPTNEPDYIDAGGDHYYQCYICQEIIPGDHEYGDPVENGSKTTRTCTLCGHNEVNDNGKLAINSMYFDPCFCIGEDIPSSLTYANRYSDDGTVKVKLDWYTDSELTNKATGKFESGMTYYVKVTNTIDSSKYYYPSWYFIQPMNNDICKSTSGDNKATIVSANTATNTYRVAPAIRDELVITYPEIQEGDSIKDAVESIYIEYENEGSVEYPYSIIINYNNESHIAYVYSDSISWTTDAGTDTFENDVEYAIMIIMSGKKGMYTTTDEMITNEPKAGYNIANFSESGSYMLSCIYYKVVAPHKHAGNLVDAEEATCTKAGTLAYYKCECGQIFSDAECTKVITNTVVDAKGHSFTTYAYNNDATCLCDGTETAKCDNCDVTDRRIKTGTMTAHTPNHEGHATEEYGIHCTYCCYEIEKQLNHTHTFKEQEVKEFYLASEATCTAAAKYYKSCKCGTAGEEEFEVGSALGHSWNGGVITKTPTTSEEGVKTFTCTRCGTTKTESVAKEAVLNGWVMIDGVEYWYEDGVRQGYAPDETGYRGKEIYDPGTDAWYWLDNIDGGKKAVSKDVFQESNAGPWGSDVNSDGVRVGKWVRYDAQGHMIKGWCAGRDAGAHVISLFEDAADDEAVYYFDTTYGTMAKGGVEIDGAGYYFNFYTGVLEKNMTGWASTDGVDYWYENGIRQGFDGKNLGYRGKEIYDPASDAWYWLDNVDGGKKATSKDVYQESLAGPWGETVNASGERVGKWVRYDAQGHMIKGWCAGKDASAHVIASPYDAAPGEAVYYFDLVYGTMAKGTVEIDGVSYTFDTATGVLK